MKPYYEHAGITIYHGDFRDCIGSLAPVDAIITDPNYGETSLDWDKWTKGWPALIQDSLKSSGTMWVFGSQRMFFERAKEFSCWKFVQDVIWEKHNGSGFFNDRFRRVHELVFQFRLNGPSWSEVYKDPQFTHDATARTVREKARPAHWTGARGPHTYQSEDGGPRLMRSVIKVRSEHGRAVHPTQKPLGIVTPLLLYSCPVGGTVLDPFMGSGTTLRAASDNGRKAIGIEIEERYCEIAANRLRQEVLEFRGD